MQPTELSKQIYPLVVEILNRLKLVQNYNIEFDPQTSNYQFKISMTDISHLVLLPKLINYLRAHAPNIRLEIVPIDANTPIMMSNGDIDLAIGFLPQLEAGFYQQTLFQQRYICIASKEHPRLRVEFYSNRMCCEKDLAKYVDDARNSGRTGALMYLDLDDFKHINDSLGHQYGDVLLQDISKAMSRIEGISNSCYRMGGDEFVIIVPPDNYHLMDKIIEEIKDAFATPWYLKDTDYYCTMSMGLVRFPENGDNVPELIRKSDVAMYEGVEFYSNRILGEFNEEYQKALATDNIAERYALMGVAEAKLLGSGVFIPLSTRGGNYALRRHIPGSVTNTLWGNDDMRFHNVLATTDFVSADDYIELKSKLNDLRGTGTYQAEAKKYLEEKGYTLTDTFNYPNTSDPKTWDVLATSRAADSEKLVNLYDGLLEYDVENVQQPALAESYEESEDGSRILLKGKSSLMLYEQFGDLKFKYRNREFWCRGYYVDTVGKNTAKIQDYIKHQLEEDKMGEQLSIPYPGSPFTGRK